MGNINWGHLLFAFDGRINRGKFWLGTAVLWGMLLLAVVLGVAIGSAVSSTLGILIVLVAYIPVIWAGLAISIKRWHDRDKSGWWIFIAFVPFIGGLWALIETGFLEGTKGDNQYGPDPLATA